MRMKTTSNPLADEVHASSALLGGTSTLRPNGAPAYNLPPDDQDSGDLPTGVDEDALSHDELDTDQLASTD